MRNHQQSWVLCFVNFTSECFYRVQFPEREVEALMCTEDAPNEISSWEASDKFVQFLLMKMQPLDNDSYLRIRQEIKVCEKEGVRKKIDDIHQYGTN